MNNEIVFPAAILQPPFFDPNADPAVNYGAIGGVIGHEIGHGFDDQGRKSDGTGVLATGGRPRTRAQVRGPGREVRRAVRGHICPRCPGSHINGELTMGENIGDLGGMTDRRSTPTELSLGGKPAPVIDGFTGDQRFFLGWAQVWRSLIRDEALRQQLVGEPAFARNDPRGRAGAQHRRLVRGVRGEGGRRVLPARGSRADLVNENNSSTKNGHPRGGRFS